MQENIKSLYKGLNLEYKRKAKKAINELIPKHEQLIPKHEPESIQQMIYTGKVLEKYQDTYHSVLSKCTRQMLTAIAKNIEVK